jgi:tetratricopeptide (TPR) repeat protein
LSESASAIWGYLERPRSAEQLSQALCAEYDVDLGQAKEDIKDFLEQLQQIKKMGSFDKAFYYRTHSYLMWMSGKHEEAIHDMEKSVAEDPRVPNLITFGEILSFVGDERAAGIWQQVLAKVKWKDLAYACVLRIGSSVHCAV